MRLHNLINRKNVIIILFSAVLILALSISYSRFFDKSPRKLYLEAEGRNFKKYSAHIKGIYKDFYSNQKPYMDTRYKNRLELTADIKSDTEKPLGIENAQNILSFIRKSKLIIDSKNNPAADTGLTNISLLLDRTPLVDASIYKKGKEAGFTIPILLPNRYFALNLDNLNQIYDKFYKRYNIPDLKPKRIARKVDMARTIRFSDDELDRLAGDYGTFISGLIEEKDVQLGRNQKVKAGSEEITGREIIVRLDSDKTRKLVQKIADKAASDGLLLKLTYENFADIAELFDEAGYFQLFKVLEDLGYLELNDVLKGFLKNLNIKKDIPGFQNNLRNTLKKITYPDGLDMVLVVDKAGNLVDRKLKLTFAEDDTASSLITVHTGSNSLKYDNFNNGFLDLSIDRTEKDGQRHSYNWRLNSNIIPSGKSDDEKGMVEISYKEKRNDRDFFSSKLFVDMDKSTDEAALKKNSLIKYNISFTGEDQNMTDNFKGELNISSWKNNKLKTRNSASTLTINSELPTLGIKNTAIKFDLKREDRFEIEDFSLPAASTASSIDLNNITDRDLSKLEQDIMLSFGTFYFKNKQLIDGLFAR